MEQTIERKSFIGMEFKKDKPGTFIACIATLNVIDKQGDVTLPGAAPAGKTILISAYMHGSWGEGKNALPIGKGLIVEKGNQILVEGEFYLNTDTGKEHYETIKNAPELQEWSYGFAVLETDEESEWNDNPKVYRVLKKFDIFESSPVLRGAGVDTALLAIKSDKDQGLTLKAQAEAALAAVDGLVSRVKSLADLRRKDGKDLSATSRAEVTRLRKGLGELEVEIKALLEAPKNEVDETVKNEMKRSLASIKKIYGGN